jgi:N-dimethylarginine dimethylaminohydrolase
VVIHCAEEDDDVVLPTYRAFLRQLPAGVQVHVVCSSEQVFEALVRRVGPTDCRLTPVIVRHPITSWARDRWLALGASRGEGTTLLCPRAEDGADVWPARQGDQQVAGDLAAALGPGVRSIRSDLYFDGGDFAADSETAFARPSILLRNLQRTVATREELVESLSGVLKHRVIVLEGAPDHHVAMVLMPVGGRTVLVGDPKMAQDVLARSEQEADAVGSFLPGGPDFSEAAVASFEKVAEHCRDAGYRVVRIPVVPGSDGRTFLTYVNAILDERDARCVVYMPVYSFAGSLNREAARVWTDLGYEVREVECDAAARNFGALHCLVNVLQRD